MTRFAPIIFLLVGFVACKTDPAPAPAATWDVLDRPADEVVIRLPSDPTRLHPLLYGNDSYAAQVMRNIFQYPMDFAYDAEMSLQPMLIVDEPALRDVELPGGGEGVAYTFDILPAARWDNGTPVTGHDYVFSVKAIFNPAVAAAPFRGYFTFIEDILVDADNPKRFTVFTNQKTLLGKAALANLTVMPAYHYDPDGLMQGIPLKTLLEANASGDEQLLDQEPKLGQFATQFGDAKYGRDPASVTGSGPYRVESWTADDRLVLVRKDNWWGDALKNRYPQLAAAPRRLVYRIIPDQAAAVTALKDGAVDVVSQIDSKAFQELQTNELVARNYDLYTLPTFQQFFIPLNTRSPLLRDKRVRRALAHTLDAQAVIDQLYYGFGQRNASAVASSKAHYNRDLPLLQLDIERARALLAEAGWTDTNGNGIVDKVIDGQTRDLTVRFLTSTSAFSKNLTALWQESARRAGIRIEGIPGDGKTRGAAVRARDYDAYIRAIGGDPVPDDLTQLWHTDSDTPDGSNTASYGDAESDALIEAIRTELDPDKRRVLYQQIQQDIYDEQPAIFLFSPKDRLAVHKRLQYTPTSRKPGYYARGMALVAAN